MNERTPLDNPPKGDQPQILSCPQELRLARLVESKGTEETTWAEVAIATVALGVGTLLYHAENLISRLRGKSRQGKPPASLKQ